MTISLMWIFNQGTDMEMAAAAVAVAVTAVVEGGVERLP